MNNTCYCGSSQKFIECCGHYHVGLKEPETAEQLMRARYSAFAARNVDFVLSTEKLAEPNTRESLTAHLWQTSWKGLKVIKTSKGKGDDSKGSVSFEATFEEDGSSFLLREESKFKKINGKWYYVSGDAKVTNL